MKYSIRRQFATIFCLLMMGTILLCWFINGTFLEKFYLNNKQKNMASAYQIINKASNEGSINSEAFDIEMQKICEKNNISFIILDTASRTLKTSTHDYENLSRRLLDNLFDRETMPIVSVLESYDNYEMRITMEARTQTELLEMWGILDNGNLFLLLSPLESIRESVKLANRFLAYVGIGSAIFSSIIILWVSGKITRPIMELAKISERMKHLDFNARYAGKSKTEVAILGKNINELSGTLEKTISELKSANNELQKDIEKKNELDAMRREFLANVSHELKTPIALIQGYAEGLKEGISDDEESRDYYCEVIMDEASKMNNIVKKLLTLNQLEFGNEIITMERFDVVALIRNYLQSAELLCKQKNIKVIINNQSPLYVWADEVMVEEIFSNYFSNAMNHVMGEMVIDIKAETIGEVIRVTVFNTGDAIPEENLPYIWDKFYKVDKARTREYGGSGVGLSIVKAMMESLNQHYGVSNYDNGVAFWFELEKAGDYHESNK